MKIMTWTRCIAVCLSTVGMVVPQAQVFAQQGGAPAKRSAVSDSKLAADVVLMSGAFTGRVVDHTGAALKGREVVVRQGEREVARATTNEKGVFSVASMRPGNYTATAGNTTGQFRVWGEEIAPPAAKGHALLVMGENGTRGQFGAVDPTLILLTAAVIATVIISAITLDKVNDVDDKVSEIPTTP